MKRAFSILAIIAAILAVLPAYAQSANDTFHMYFSLDKAMLDNSHKQQIDQLVYNDHILQQSNVLIIGYADYLGTSAYNKELSLRRSQNIKDYLVKYGLSANNIKLCIGKGEIERKVHKNDGSPVDRRVDIVVLNSVAVKRPVASKPHAVATIVRAPVAPSVIKKDTIKKLPQYIPAANTTLADITKYKPGQTILLKNIYFVRERHAIKEESFPQLQALYQALEDNPRIRINIEGHICCVIDFDDALDIDNMDPHLSLNRARAIYEYLLAKGIDAARLKYVGFGRRRPIVSKETTEEEADRNRRVEIRILEN